LKLFLAKGGNVNLKAKGGVTLLHEAAFRGHTEVIKTALEYKANPNLKNDLGQTSLHLVAHQTDCAAAKALLTQVTDLGVQDKDGNTALHIAARLGMEEPLREFIRAGADPNARNKTGGTPLIVSCFHGHEGISDFLLSIGSSPKTADDRGQTALHYSVMAKEPSCSIVQVLLESGASAKTKDANGMSVLDKVISQLSDPALSAPHSMRIGRLMGCVQLLHQAGADMNVLHQVVRKSKGSAAGEKMMQLLIELGADMHQPDSTGEDVMEMTMSDVKKGLMSPFDASQVVQLLVETDERQALESGSFHDDSFRNERSPSLRSTMSGTAFSNVATHDGYTETSSLAGSNLTSPVLTGVPEGEPILARKSSLIRERSPSEQSGSVYGSSASIGPVSRGGVIVLPPSASRSARGGSSVQGSIRSPPMSPALKGKIVVTPNPEAYAQRELMMHGTPDRIRSDLDSFLDAKEVENTPKKHSRHAAGVNLVNRVIDEGTMTDEAIRELIVTQSIQVNERGSTGRNPMYYAAMHGRTGLMQILASFGGDLEAVDEEGTLLHKAAGAGKPSMAQCLLNMGANPSTQTRGGRTPLMIAAAEKSGRVTEVLAKANPGLVDERDPKGLTALHYAAQSNREGSVIALLRSGAAPNATDMSGCTPLMLAAYHGFARCVEALINYRAPLNSVDYQGRTAAHWGVGYEWSNPEVIQILVKYGASCNMRDEDDKTPLDAAVQCLQERKTMGGGNPDHVLAVQNIVKVLIEAGCKPNIVSNILASTDSSLATRPVITTLVEKGAGLNEIGIHPSTRLPLEVVLDSLNDGLVARSDAEKMICFLIEKGADVNMGNVSNADTPLHHLLRCHGLAATDKVKVVTFLIEQCRAQVNIANSVGETPLSVALYSGDPAMVNYLVASGADASIKDDDGSSTLDRLLMELSKPKPIDAESSKETERLLSLVQLLLKNGADVNILHKVIQATHGSKECFDPLAELLINQGADVNCEANGFTPVQFAVSSIQSGGLGRLDGQHVISFLLEHGADLNCPTDNRDTCLHIAVSRGQLSANDTRQLVEFLLEKPNPNPNPNPNTRQLVEFLLEKGAEKDAANSKGHTPLMIAVDSLDIKLCELLVEKYKASCKGRDCDMNNALNLMICSRENKKLDEQVYDAMAAVTRFVLMHGLDVDAANKYGETSLLRSIGLNTSKVTSVILDLGADADKSDKRGKTPFRRVFEELCRGPGADRMTILNTMAIKLVQFGAEYDIGINGVKPLSHAIKICDYPLLDVLCNKGADVNEKDIEGFTYMQCLIRDLAKIPSGDKSTAGKVKFVLAAAKQLITKGAGNDHISEVLQYTAGSREGLMFVLLLVEMGAQINSCDERTGLSAVHTVVNRIIDGTMEPEAGKSLINWLEEQGASIAALSSRGRQDSPLHSAAAVGHLDAVKIILGLKNTVINVRNGHGDTPVKLAAAGGYNDAMDELLAGLCDVNIANDERHGLQAPVHVAALNGHHVTVQKLVQQDADIAQTANGGKNVLHLLLDLSEQQYTEEHRQLVLDLIRKGGSNFNKPDGNGDTCLRLAIKHSRRQLALTLIQKDAELESPDKDGKSLLRSILEELVFLSSSKEGAESERAHFLWFFGLIFIQKNADLRHDKELGFLAVQLRDPEMMQSMLEHDLPPNTLDEDGVTVLWHVIDRMCDDSESPEEGVQDLLQEMSIHLLDNGADVNVGVPLIFDAIKSKREKTVATVIENGGRKCLEVKDKDGLTPVALAVKLEATPSMVKILLQNKAAANVKMSDGTPALVVAFERGDAEVVRLLVYHGAETSGVKTSTGLGIFEAILAQLGGIGAEDDKDSKKVIAVETMSSGFIDKKVESPNCIHKVLDITKCSNAGAHFVSFLATKGADVNSELDASEASGKSTQLKRTPILHAMDGVLNNGWDKKGAALIVSTLVEKGATVDATCTIKSMHGRTALHMAVAAGDQSIVRQLMSHGASPNVRATNGDTALIEETSLTP